MSALPALTAAELAELYRSRSASPVETLAAVLDRHAAVDGTINAFREIDAHGAMAAARASEARWQAGEPLGPLDGIPVSGQDADHAALNRVAQGTQTVSVWKDSRDLGRRAGEIAVELAGDASLAEIEGAEEWESPAGTTLWAEFLEPVPITQDNLDVVVDAGWISQEALCQGVEGGPAPCN